MLDLVDQDHRIAGDHADQRQHAQQRHEAQRLVGHQQRRDDADETERRHAQHQEQAAEAWSWIISTVSMRTNIKGTTAATDTCALSLSSAVPPISMR